MPLLRLIALYWKLVSAAVLIAISFFSLMPLSELPQVPGSDKTHHVLSYACLMFPVALNRPKYYLLIAFFFIAWSGALELIQPFVNRYAEWGDLGANALGVVLGILIANSVRLFIKF